MQKHKREILMYTLVQETIQAQSDASIEVALK
jgi:hypothetical protein